MCEMVLLILLRAASSILNMMNEVLDDEGGE